MVYVLIHEKVSRGVWKMEEEKPSLLLHWSEGTCASADSSCGVSTMVLGCHL